MRKINPNIRQWTFLLAVFYLVGLLGLMHNKTRGIFLNLTPLTLLFSFLILMFFQENIRLRSVFIYLTIAVCGFFIELIGVKTGKIFGEYVYGRVLGWKVLQTPLIIGLNWLMLTISTYSISAGFKMGKMIKIILSSFLMLAYDVALEPVAISTDMWTWVGDKIPLQNYFSWYVISFIFQSFLHVMAVSGSNRMAKPVFTIQFIFFILLNFNLH